MNHENIKLQYVIFPLILLIGISIFPVTAIAQTTSIPDWVKNNALWWAEGKISEQEYLNSLQFLIEKEIIIVNNPTQSSSEPTSNDTGTLFFTQSGIDVV